MMALSADARVSDKLACSCRPQSMSEGSRSDIRRTYGIDAIFDSEGWRHNNIGRLLNNALARFEHCVLTILAQDGHSDIRYSYINLARNLDAGGTIITELAQRSGITKQAMGEMVAQCNRLGLVERIGDSRDRRAKIVRFTPAGLEWREAFCLALSKAEQEMRDGLGYQRTDAIASALSLYGGSFDGAGKPD
jgi:DNA-binding MarR family transcriptional regulator